MSKTIRCQHLILSALLLLTAGGAAICKGQEAQSRPVVVETGGAGDFRLEEGQNASPLYVDASDDRVVHIAAEALASDLERVTGAKSKVADGAPQEAEYAVLIGTLGKSTSIDHLVAAKKLDVAGVQGARESFVIATVRDPVPGVRMGLIIAGSDRRGTAYGVFTLSEAIGVSPWYWWADVPTRHHNALFVRSGLHQQGPPAVKYRGIFINDEDWGLQPWAAKTFEPEVNNIGPKTYARICELLLRLRGNLIWPAMHPSTTPFFQVPGNAAVADEYAIIVGSSHAEPMLRNNEREWKAPRRNYNYLTHRDEVLSYWEERVKERTSGESLFTIGMRGISDGPIVGPKTQADRINTLEKVFADQRGLLARYLGNGDPTRVGQMFCPYKEVLDDYNAGLRVPEDATIVWPDDNFGYIRRFATPAERARAGGLGVYYHASYLGAPLAWTWIDTLSPALLWSEMTRAYEQGARTVWIINVGDIKNTERSMEFFLDLAWHANNTGRDDPGRFMRATAARDFGADLADPVVDILTRFQAINFARKTEHLQWHIPLTPYKPTELNETEIHERLDACSKLLQDSDALAERLGAETRDAYFELVGYPVGITAAANERYFRSELARADVARGRSPEANNAAAGKAESRIGQLTVRYNNEIAGGKWRNIVTVNGISPNDWKRFQRDISTVPPKPGPDNVAPPALPEPEALARPSGARAGDFVERGGVVSMHAGHFTAQSDLPSGAGWRSVPGLGRSGCAVTVMPSTATISHDAAPSLSYRFHVATAGPATLRVRMLPTCPIVSGRGLRLSLAIDDGAALPLAVISGFDPKSAEWMSRVLSNATEASIELPNPLAPGWHTLRLIAVDAGVVVDKIVLDLGGLRPSYDGPIETRLP